MPKLNLSADSAGYHRVLRHCRSTRSRSVSTQLGLLAGAWKTCTQKGWLRSVLMSVHLALAISCFSPERRSLAQPVYRMHHPASLRYPLSHKGAVFEQRIDSYMRVRHRFRLTDTRVQCKHLGEEGANYPHMSPVDRALRKTLLTAARFGMSASRRSGHRAATKHLQRLQVSFTLCEMHNEF